MKRMNFPHRKRKRQAEAAARQVWNNALTIEEKAEKIKAATRPGSITRELALRKLGIETANYN